MLELPRLERLELAPSAPPMATLLFPVQVTAREPHPIATLLEPVVRLGATPQPIATLLVPVVTDVRALQPRAVLVASVQPLTVPNTVGVAVGTALAAPHLIPSAHVESAMRTWPSEPTGKGATTLGPVPVTKVPLAVTQDLGIAATATSNAVFTAREVAAVAEDKLDVESESWTAPHAAVVAAAMLTVAVPKAVLTEIGAVPTTEPTAVPLDAAVMRP